MLDLRKYNFTYKDVNYKFLEEINDEVLIICSKDSIRKFYKLSMFGSRYDIYIKPKTPIYEEEYYLIDKIETLINKLKKDIEKGELELL